jgi:predicted dehydrogenase
VVARVYDGYREMATQEGGRDYGVDVVAVVTPNDTHFEVAKAFLEAGISVACGNPLANDAAWVDFRAVTG